MSLLSSATLKISVFDLRLVVSLQQVLELAHTSGDSHVWYLVCLLEAVEEFELGVIFFALELGEI